MCLKKDEYISPKYFHFNYCKQNVLILTTEKAVSCSCNKQLSVPDI